MKNNSNNQQQKTSWYQINITDVKKLLETDTSKGLNKEQVLERQGLYGKNSFEEKRKITIFERIFIQFKSPLVFILLLATVATFFLEEYIDMWVIIVALTINVVIGIIQEKRADKAFEQLTASQEKFATVIRNGEKMEVHAEELVPGDIILLKAGGSVPADARIVTSHVLQVNESSLTGEWEDVSKKSTVIKESSRITEQFNMLWMGTLITKGNAKAVIISTGLQTEFGKIAEELAKTEEDLIPLQKNIRKLAFSLSFVILVAIIVILVAGLDRKSVV